MAPAKVTFNQYEAMLDGIISNVLLEMLVCLKCIDRDGHMKHDESEACWKTPGLAVSTIPDSGAPGPAESGSEAACGVAVFCSSGDPDSSPAVQAATERSLLLDVQLLNHKRRQGSERRRKINPVHRAYPRCAANLLTL